MSSPPESPAVSQRATTRSNSKRLIASPTLNEPSKRAAVLAPNDDPVHPVTQPDGMDWEDVKIPRKSPIKPVPTVLALGAPKADEHFDDADDDDEENADDDDDEEKEDEDDYVEPKDTQEPARAARLSFSTPITTDVDQTSKTDSDDDYDDATANDALLFADNPTGTVDAIQYPLPTNTVADSLCRHLVCLLRHDQPNPDATSIFITHWSAIATDPALFQAQIQLQPTDSIGAPVMLLALDAATSTVVVLHHFAVYTAPDKEPQLVALADDRINAKAPPQLVFLNAK
jgi:hypothetical protein